MNTVQFCLERMRKLALYVVLAAVFATVVRAAEPTSSEKSELAEKFSTLLNSQCLDILVARSKLLKTTKSPVWIACLVRAKNGKVSILASVAAHLDQVGPGATLFAANEQAEIRAEIVTWREEGPGYFVRANCDYTEFRGGQEQPLSGATRIEYVASPNQAFNPSGVREGLDGNPKSMDGTGVVVILR